MKSLMVCVNLENDSVNGLKEKLAKINWHEIKDVHFVHGFQTQYYSDNFNITTYPSLTDQENIKAAVIETLETFQKEIFQGQTPQVINQCLISSKPKADMVDYAHKNKIDEMIIATKVKSGFERLFSSSFSEYMLRHADCSIHIIRIK